ncbi:MAG: hypothetical protein AB7G47_13940 [Mycolicibacterium sp.]|uniref:hypothetical protein n=1 Tax=Mycolicibacterium sp. TaxID=2320850 RepID=UPI003D0A1D62
MLTRLVPAGAGCELTADRAAELLRSVRPRDVAAKTLRALAVDLISEVRQLDRWIHLSKNRAPVLVVGRVAGRMSLILRAVEGAGWWLAR